MDITSLLSVGSPAVAEAAKQSTQLTGETAGDFGSIFSSALSNINTTDHYIKKMNEEEVKWMMGLSENTHDLSIATSKASSALQYTVSLRDRFLEAYKEIIQIQI